MVELEMQVAGLPDWQTKMVNPNFAQVAEACGIRGYSIKNPENLEKNDTDYCDNTRYDYYSDGTVFHSLLKAG